MVSNGPQSDGSQFDNNQPELPAPPPEQVLESDLGEFDILPLVEPFPLAEPSDDYYEIRIVTREIPVRVNYTAIRALRIEIASKETSLGLLRGTRSLDAISIDQFELLTPEAAPEGLIDPRLPKVDQSILGFFRTHSNGWPEIVEMDRTNARQCFPGKEDPARDSAGIFALIHNPGHRPWSAELFDLAQNGEFLTKDGAHEFYFDEYLLKSGYSTAPPQYNEPEEEVPEVETDSRGSILGGVWLVLAALVIIGAVGYGVTRWDAVKDKTETLAHSRMQAVSQLMLAVRRSGDDYEITWSREAPVLEQANAATLVISDGEVTKTFTLERDQWRAGRAVYTPLPLSPKSGDVKIRFELEQGARSQSESIRIPLKHEMPLSLEVSEYAGKLRTASGVEAPTVVDTTSLVANLPQRNATDDTKPTLPIAIFREPPKLNATAKKILAGAPLGSRVFVSVRVVVDANGNVTTASVAPGANEVILDESLQSAALDAARRWKYKPSMVNGTAVQSETTITFNFQ